MESWKPSLSSVERPGARGLSAAPVYVSRRQVERDGERARHYLESQQVTPLMGQGEGQIVALMVEPYGAIDEHSADEDIVVLVFSGTGRSRVGGPTASWISVGPGEAVLWPAGALHLLEAGPDGIELRVVHLPSA